MNPYYQDYNEFLGRLFPGVKVQKISVNAGFSCPNRDGTIGRGGCIYCDNSTFTPAYCLAGGSIGAQMAAGKEFFRLKYPEMKYLAYFQSFTPTHGPLTQIREMWREAIEGDDVAGLVVGTRPDCLPGGVVDMLAEINREKPVIVEIGVETMHDETLRFINRGHNAQNVCDAMEHLAAAGLTVGAHLIAGLPGENDAVVLDNVRRICSLPVSVIKMHQLQVIRGTELHRRIEGGELQVEPYTLERYLDLCVNIVGTVPRRIAIERFLASSPPEKVVAPKWGLKNYQFVNLLHGRLAHIKTK